MGHDPALLTDRNPDNGRVIAELKDQLVIAKMEHKVLEQKLYHSTLDLNASKIECQQISSKIAKIDHSEQDIDTFKQLHHFRELVVSATLKNWKKRVRSASRNLQQQLASKQDELGQATKDTQDLIDEYSMRCADLKWRRKEIEALRI